MDKGTIARTVVLVIMLINQGLTMMGWNPLPWSDDQVYAGVSAVLAIGAAAWSWWKNNSVTKAAKAADKYLTELKAKE